MALIIECFKNTVMQHGSDPAVIQQDLRYTWKELDDLSEDYALYLQKKGICKGQHVGLMDYNGIHWILVFLGLLKIGAIAVLLNVNYTKRELSEILKISETAFLYAGQDVWNHLNEDLSSEFELRKDLLLTEADLEEIIKRHETEKLSRRMKPVRMDGTSPACFMFTTGSTARPKCVILSNSSLMANAEAMADVMEYGSTDRICVATPLFHIFSLVCNFLSAMITGAVSVFPENIKSLGLINCICEKQCSVFNGVPTSYLAMVANQEFEPDKVQSIRVGTLGGAKVNRKQMETLKTAFPNTELMINYGSTEAGFACNTDKGDGIEILSSSVGRPMQHMEIAIEDLNTHKVLPYGSPGEVLVRGGGLMDGYYGLPEEEQAIDKNGYLHTGDIGFLDKDGRLTISDRKKNIIIRGGENISPSEIEKVILKYDAVEEVIVLGIPHPVLGEVPAAFLTVKQGAFFEERQLRKILFSSLAKYKVPSRILVIKEFPLLANGKKDIRALKQKQAF